jgi:fucose permease
MQSLIMAATTYFVPVYFQVVLGASPFMSGVYFLPTTITLALLWASIGHLIKKTGQYVPSIRLGAAGLLLGTDLLIDTKAYISWPRIISAQIIIAAGLGLTYQAPLVAFYEVIPREDASAGTSTFQFLKQIGQTISIVFGQLIIQGYIETRLKGLVQQDKQSELLRNLSTGEMIPSLLGTGANSDEGALLRGILTHGIRVMWMIYTGIAAITFVASFGVPMHRLPLDAPEPCENEKSSTEEIAGNTD